MSSNDEVKTQIIDSSDDSNTTKRVLVENCDYIVKYWARAENVYLPNHLVPLITRFHISCDIILIYSNRIALCNIIAPQSQPKAEPLPIDRKQFPFHASTVQRNKKEILIMGGTARSTSTEFRSFNIETMTLTPMPAMKHARYDAGRKCFEPQI